VPPRIQSLSVSKASGILKQIEFDDEERFTSAQIERFKADPELYRAFIKAIEEQVNSNFFIVREPFSILPTGNRIDVPSELH